MSSPIAPLRPQKRPGSGSFVRAALLALVAAAAASPASAEPRLGEYAGEVEIGRGDPPRWIPARPGDVLHAGDSVRTGRGARAEIDLGTGTVRLFEASLLRLPPEAMRPEGPSAVSLENGDSLFEVQHRKPGDPFEVRTPEVVASVKGTRFSVQLGGDRAAVSVFSGLVGVRGPAAQLSSEVLVRSGFAAVGGANRPFELSLQSTIDPWARWQDGGPPPPMPASPSAARERGDDVETAKGAALDAVVPQLAAGGAGRGAVPASMAPDGTASAGLLGEDAEPPSDPVSLAGKNGLANGVQREVVETLVNGVRPAADGVTPVVASVPLILEPVKSGGPNSVLVSTTTGLLAEVTQNDIQTILDTGNTSLLGTNLLQVLSTNGQDPLAFTRSLDKLF